jgi:hypothetical protein
MSRKMTGFRVDTLTLENLRMIAEGSDLQLGMAASILLDFALQFVPRKMWLLNANAKVKNTGHPTKAERANAERLYMALEDSALGRINYFKRIKK